MKTERAIVGSEPYPYRLIGSAVSDSYIELDLNKEPTLLQTRTKLESFFMMDSRIALAWAACREKPHDFLGRRRPK